MPDALTRPVCWVTWDCCPDGSCARCESGTAVPYRRRSDSITDAKREAARLSAETPGSTGFVMSSHIDTGQPNTCIAEFMYGRDVDAGRP